MKKIICMLLAAVTVFAFIGCGEKPADPSVTTENAAAISTEGDSEITTDRYLDNLPDEMDFGGETILIVSMDRDWWADEITPSENDGTLVNNAVETRNDIVEERLKVKIDNKKLASASYSVLADEIVNADKDGSGLYDISFCNSYKACAIITKGLFVDLNKVSNLDLSRDYWMQGLNEQISFHGSQYVASGDIALSSCRMAFATIFNKDMFAENHVPLLYDTVNAGNWTLEYQLSLFDTFHKPTNPDTPSDEDIYAFVSNTYDVSDGYWEGCDLSILRKNADGDYEYSTDGERYSAIVDGVLALFRHKGTKAMPTKSDDSHFQDISKFFADGKAAMATITLNECEREWTRNMADAYGIVPIPKLNKDQTEHHTHLFDQYSVVSILKSTAKDDLSVLGAFLEAMASESSRTTMPAYYELTLKQKYQSDPTSWEMLDMLMHNVICDAGNLYYSLLSGPHMEMAKIITSGTNTVSSKMASYKRMMNVYVPKLNNDLAKVNAGN